MKKINKYLLLFFIIVFSFSGCVKTLKVSNDNSVTEIKFKDMTNVSELKKLSGKQIKIKGYLAQSSPLDGSMAYVMNMPYQSCVFCVPNTNQLVNTLAIYPEKGKKLDFTDLAIEVQGTLVFENITDEMGYSYNYRLINATSKLANLNDLADEVRIYTQLVDQGFVYTFYDVITAAEQILNYKKYGFDINGLTKIDASKVTKLKDMFKTLKEEEYKDVISIVNTLEEIVTNINSALDTKDTSTFEKDNQRAEKVYNELYEWLMKPEF